MGADATANLYLGVDLDDVFTYEKESIPYELHDPRTGEKTGQIEYEYTDVWTNVFTNEKVEELGDYFYDIEKKYGIMDDLLISLGQESDCAQIIGFKIADNEDDNDGWSELSAVEEARIKFERILRPIIGDLKPRLLVNLYWSY